jgi:hypothetical protein
MIGTNGVVGRSNWADVLMKYDGSMGENTTAHLRSDRYALEISNGKHAGLLRL